MRETRFVPENDTNAATAFARFAVTLSVSFTTIMVIAMAAGSILAPSESQAGIVYCWSIFGACAVAALLQAVFFTDLVLKRAGDAIRVGLFGACLYGALAIVAAVARWFPVDNPGAWVAFTVIYLAVLVALTTVFRLMERRQAREFDEMLEKYRAEHGE